MFCLYLVLQFGFVIREVGAVRIKDTKRIIIRHFVNLCESLLKLMMPCIVYIVTFTMFQSLISKAMYNKYMLSIYIL